MKIQDLKDAPQWLLDADTNFADVEIIDGIVHWNGGVWKEGVWQNGVWKDGIWANGVWKDGYWFKGSWYEGKWEKGHKWENGKAKLVPSDTPPSFAE